MIYKTKITMLLKLAEVNFMRENFVYFDWVRDALNFRIVNGYTLG